MFNFSGHLSQSEYWPKVLLNFIFLLISVMIARSSHNLALALIFWLSALLLYINGMGITARRLRDAGKTDDQLTAYYGLIFIPAISVIVLIVYFFIAGFTPSRASAEEQQAEASAQAARRAQAEREWQRKYEEQERQNRAKAWAEAEQSAAYQAQAAEPSAADREQAAAWAKEEAEKEQKLLAKQQATLRLPKN